MAEEAHERPFNRLLSDAIDCELREVISTSFPTALAQTSRAISVSPTDAVRRRGFGIMADLSAGQVDEHGWST